MSGLLSHYESSNNDAVDFSSTTSISYSDCEASVGANALTDDRGVLEPNRYNRQQQPYMKGSTLLLVGFPALAAASAYPSLSSAFLRARPHAAPVHNSWCELTLLAGAVAGPSSPLRGCTRSLSTAAKTSLVVLAGLWTGNAYAERIIFERY
mmetsp:Transcript_5284/g.11496  ORF Transcript_5284/g.11496 Transcript_5284/m.11496 type:complete len:152 (+) Transcript_5284:75-530(+)|eukprot:CAMPEP_0178519470 /NCGR_PEP_ID=MMETSP0696-20121128/26847_1 /TAXON_ID=265572 /ORGANISM="Extubocellulus spinifer, Strain CCMP396" /LENGTH=151 /DNA_ID=CAMNT_0020150181 /DNA_START=5 /DNA_END=460 /DNA_ORIENTATION=+